MVDFTVIQDHPVAAAKTSSPRARILGLNFDVISTSKALERVQEFVSSGTPHQVFFSNASSVAISVRDTVFRDAVNHSDLNCPDGMSIVWAGRLLGVPFPERVAGPDFTVKALELAAKKGYRVYFMGCAPSTLDRIKSNLLRRWPALQIVGLYSPPMCDKLSDAETAKIIAELKEARPDFLLVGLSCPKQEKWIAENRRLFPVSVCFAIGAAFDFMAGTTSRAPLFFRNMGLEWLYRLMAEPRRLWKRYFIGNTRFLYLLVKEMFQVRLLGKKIYVESGAFERQN